MFDTPLLLLALAVLAWFLFVRKRPSVNPIGEIPRFQHTEQVRDWGEALDDPEVRSAINEREEQEALLWSESLERQEAAAAARFKIEKAMVILKETGLAEAIPNLWQNLKNDIFFERDQPEYLSEIQSRTFVDQGDNKTVSWGWKGTAYALQCKHPNQSPTLTLTVGGDEVLEMVCSIEGQWFQSYAFAHLESLRVGAWMSEVIQMDGLMQRAQDRFMDSISEEMDRDTADRIDLGDAEEQNESPRV